MTSAAASLFKWRRNPLDLQAKVFLILVAVIVPTFFIVTVAENQLTRPLLHEEMKQMGITTGKTIAADLVSSRLLNAANPSPRVEKRLQELLYARPNVIRVDVFARDMDTGRFELIASSVEDEPGSEPRVVESGTLDRIESRYQVNEGSNEGYWQIIVPIEQRGRDAKAPKKILGSVHVQVSTDIIDQISTILLRTTVSAALCSVVILILLLSYLLRKTIQNERLLRQAESQNLQLTAQLHETQRQVMNMEKLAVMGQLTASFAHEIGTPLTAIGGHLQLLQEAIPPNDPRAGVWSERLEIIRSQVDKIAQIVKGFLQSTAKPSTQRQLVDVNRIVDQTLGLVHPRAQSIGVQVQCELDRSMGPIRAVPFDLEQIVLNLVNNSLDSLSAKLDASERKAASLKLKISTRSEQADGKEWAITTIHDSGGGIPRQDLKKVLKPFFTTKRPGQGTGLGLTICQQLAQKHKGSLLIDSREGAWTQVTVRIPYEGTIERNS